MAKEQLYHIGDRPYFNAVERACRALKKDSHQYIVVGGTGVQFHIAHLLSDSGRKSIDELLQEGSLSEGSNIRRTNDCDIALILNPKHQDLIKTLESMKGDYETEDNIYNLEWERMGFKRPIAVLPLL